MNNMPDTPETTPALKRALFALKDMRAKLDVMERAKTEPIAIVGMGCRFPGHANTPEEFWQLLRDGVNGISDVPDNRWDVEAYYDPDPNAPGKMYVRRFGFVDKVDQFEPQFFGITPREALSMDPQQRLLLEVSWEALEYAGIVPGQLAGSQTGVFIGISTNDYSRIPITSGDRSYMDAYLGTGTAFSVAAGRLSYTLGVHGPAFALDTACSSSLVAIHLACQSLRAGQSSLALAGGVNLILSPDATIAMAKTHALAPDGQCKTFDASADGYSRGEGCGIVVLKRLSDALADGDNILALIRGSAINHDGRSSGLTVPNGQAQQAVIRAALADAGGIEPDQVNYIETHGTGTQLGDPIEVRAIAGVMGKRSKDQPVLLGSVKTNVGHAEAAAGMASLLKVILALQNGTIPPQLHFNEPNPHIDWQSLPVKVVDEPKLWQRGDSPRIAGINSFGISGTNAHLVLEEPPLPEASKPEMERPLHVMALSANDESALAELAGRFDRYMDDSPNIEFADIAHTANIGRSHRAYRLAVVGDSTGQIREKLSGFASRKDESGVIQGRVEGIEAPKVAFLFTGQGSQYVHMGRELYETQPLFKATLDKCDELLRPYLGRPLLSVLYPEAGQDSPINETAYTQPALFALEYALAELWRSWGVQPSVVMGHSVGEYVAACVAGVFSLEDGLKLIAERGRLMQALPRDGAMAAVFANKSRVLDAIAPHSDRVSIAAVNGPENIVISGQEAALQMILEQFAAEGIKSSRLAVSHAFHSPLMEPMLKAFREVAASIQYSKPKVSLISNVTGQAATLEQIGNAEYWCTHVRQSVEFQQAMLTLQSQGYKLFLEIGPQPVLSGMGKHCITDKDNLWLPSLRQQKRDWQQMLDSLGALYVRGSEVDWDRFDENYSYKKVSLPTYPFQRQRYWLELPKTPRNIQRETLHPLLHHRVRSPKLQGSIFESEVSVEFPALLNDHRIYGKAIFPGTGYLEMALAAAKQVFDGRNCSLNDVAIHEVLPLPDEGDQTTQIVLSNVEADHASFEIFSLQESASNPAQENWKLHASGTIRSEPVGSSSVETVDLEQLKKVCPNPFDVAPYYQRLADLGLEYGPAFQGIHQIWGGESEVLGQIILPAENLSESQNYQLHPALLDACFQLLGVATPTSDQNDNSKVYVPVGLQSLTLHQPGQGQAWVHGSFSSPIFNSDGTLSDVLTQNLRLFNETGELIAEVTGLQSKQINRELIRKMSGEQLDDWLYELTWKLFDRQTVSKQPVTGTWVILADENGIGDRLASILEAQGATCVLVRQGESYQQVDQAHWQIDPGKPEHFQQLFLDIHRPDNQPYRGVIHLWSVDNPFDAFSTNQKTDSLLQSTQSQISGGILHLVQAMAQTLTSDVRLWLVSRGVYNLDEESIDTALAQSGVWGLGRTITMEYPEWQCTCVDLDLSGRADHSQALFEEISIQDDETQVMLRGDERYIARLEYYRPKASNRLVKPGEPFELVTTSPGVLDNLTLRPAPRRKPEIGEVEIQIKATGLNFKDVLNALGMYPGPTIPLGNEFAGVVVSLGEGVTDFAIGDEVIGLAPGTFSAFITVSADRIFARPGDLSLVEAATIPVTFLTAYYGLHHLAHMKAGDRVLIHAAAGGVGMAAVQLARRAGAEIFGTAGSPEKRAFVQAMGVQHVLDSRSLDFADEIMRITGGQGVNIVLNSLADEFIPKSLSILADHGYFLEMGKRDDWDQAKVAQVNSTLTYHRYDLGTAMVEDLPLIRYLMDDLLTDFETEVLKPLPVRSFPIEEAREAFRFMAQAKHIGKIVITQSDKTAPVRGDGAYLITGGLGGLGLVTARWLVEHGAKHLALMSRSQPSEETRQSLAELQAKGVQIVLTQGDVSQRADVECAFQKIKREMPPLRGVIHAAGILDDGILSQLDVARFDNVMAPKAMGAWHLHALTQDQPLDFFVLFSSTASLLGGPGQGNYATANAFLDGLAHYRRQKGLPALSIDWATWSDVGMSLGLDSHAQKRRAAQGVDLIRPSEGMMILEQLLSSRPVQVGVLPINWKRYSQHLDGKQAQSILRHLVKVKSQIAQAPTSGIVLEKLKTAPESERESILHQYAQQQVVKTLGLDPSKPFDTQRMLADIGMDSLMAVELKNKIDGDFGMNIPVAYFLEKATVAGLAKMLLEQYSNENHAPASEDGSQNGNSHVSTTMDSETAKNLLSNLDQLSEDEVNSLLSSMLVEEKEDS